ncbi:MAG TPA: sigma-54-dependent Fis family transcriptional regulator, partial [Syntrophomonas sp.]|nr:sigma-54-dependent Fis family transcriptional regulator [Syntrophomonas sp.]
KISIKAEMRCFDLYINDADVNISNFSPDTWNAASTSEVYSTMQREIQASWLRSKEMGVDPSHPQFRSMPLERLSLTQEKSLLLKVSQPYLKNLYHYMEGCGFAFYITDANGLVLDLIGDHQEVKKAENAFQIPGSNWSEEAMGCNGISLCIKSGRPIRIVRDQHYLNIAKSWSGAGAPIIARDGKLLGVFGLTTSCQDVNPYSLAMVIGTTNALSLAIQMEQEKPKYFENNMPIKSLRKNAHTNGRYTFEKILGNSLELKKALNLANRAASLPGNIMLTGESGTGKEMFAQAIHEGSPRCNGPFIAVNCAAIPQELIASELFGYEEGAFTGARRNGATGKFEQAEGGTLFLDEIGNMPIDEQPALLRVLQEKEVVRLGGKIVHPVNVRIICATNQDLTALVEEKKFRSDLFYRLNVLAIHIPTLRERSEDIPLLVEIFTSQYNQEQNTNFIFSPEALNIMKEYDWPGNVRELQNAVQKAFFNADNDYITAEQLKFLTADSPADRKNESLNLKMMEEKYISKALAKSNNDVAIAAELLGISKTTLYRRIKDTFGEDGIE